MRWRNWSLLCCCAGLCLIPPRAQSTDVKASAWLYSRWFLIAEFCWLTYLVRELMMKQAYRRHSHAAAMTRT